MQQQPSVPFPSIPRFFLFCFLVGVLAGPGSARARTISVPESSPTIKEAMIQAEAGDIILVSCGTYREHDIHVKPGVALWSGTLQPGCVTIDAGGRGTVFHLEGADTTTAIVGLTIQGGRSADVGGALVLRNSSPRISNCIFQENRAPAGGALHVDASSHPVLTNCLFQDNVADQMGGAAQIAGTLELRQCAFKANLSAIGGALHAVQGAELKIGGCSFARNEAGNTGGALALQEARATMVKSVFAENLGGVGGAVLSLHEAPVQMEACTLVGNWADSEGAVLAVRGQAPVIVNTIVAFSRAPIMRTGSPQPRFQGCNLFGNAFGDWEADLGPLAGIDGNISRDPRFCAPEYGNYMLKSDSACLPGNNPAGNEAVIGAHGAGCTSNGTPHGVEPSSGFRAVRSGL